MNKKKMISFRLTNEKAKNFRIRLAEEELTTQELMESVVDFFLDKNK